MASPAARKRLMKEQSSMEAGPPPYIYARPAENDILTWHYVMRGPKGSVYEGGEYHGLLLFPPQYPFKPPGIKMLTPSGRFEVNAKICTSYSDFHPDTWNPSWSVSTILTGLLSFFLEDEVGTGGIRATPAERKRLAGESRAFNRDRARNRKFGEVFADILSPSPEDGQKSLDQILEDSLNQLPPPQPTPTSTTSKPTISSTSTTSSKPSPSPTPKPLSPPTPALPAPAEEPPAEPLAQLALNCGEKEKEKAGGGGEKAGGAGTGRKRGSALQRLREKVRGSAGGGGAAVAEGGEGAEGGKA